MVLVTIEIPQWRVDKVSMLHYAGRPDFPVVVQRQIPMVRTRRTTEISRVASQGDRCPCWWIDGAETVVVPQLQFIDVRRLPLRAPETAPHGPPCSEDHRVSSVAVCCLVVDAPVMQVVFHARCCWRAWFRHGYGFPCDPAATLGCDSQVPQTQSSPEFVDILLRNRDRYAQLQLCMVGMMAAMWGSLLQFCSIFRPPSICTLRPRVAGTSGV